MKNSVRKIAQFFVLIIFFGKNIFSVESLHKSDLETIPFFSDNIDKQKVVTHLQDNLSCYSKYKQDFFGVKFFDNWINIWPLDSNGLYKKDNTVPDVFDEEMFDFFQKGKTLKNLFEKVINKENLVQRDCDLYDAVAYAKSTSDLLASDMIQDADVIDFSKIDDQDSEAFERLRKVFIYFLSREYKIHLQVKEKYCLWLINDLMYLCATCSELSKIYAFKFVSEYTTECFNKKYACPVVVLYVQDLYGSKKDRQEELGKIIELLTGRYKHVYKKIALKDKNNNPVRPRLNKKINDLVWLSGGQGYNKIINLSDLFDVLTDD